MKTVAYDYLFNYFGNATYNGRHITGASISIAIRVYKDGKEVKFEDSKEPTTNGRYLCDIFDVSFDRDKLFVIERNLYVDNLFRLVFDFEKIEVEIVGFYLDYLIGSGKDYVPDLPDEIANLPMSEPMEVSEEDFKKFLSDNINDFDIPDNKHAQCPSVSFI